MHKTTLFTFILPTCSDEAQEFREVATHARSSCVGAIEAHYAEEPAPFASIYRSFIGRALTPDDGSPDSRIEVTRWHTFEPLNGTRAGAIEKFTSRLAEQVTFMKQGFLLLTSKSAVALMRHYDLRDVPTFKPGHLYKIDFVHGFPAVTEVGVRVPEVTAV